METKIVNVKVSHIRPDYNDLKDWMGDKKNVYIGRKGIVFVTDTDPDNKKCRWPKKDSKWCNPYKINNTTTREQSLEKYKKYLKSMLEDNATLEEFKTLRGKTLGCWCHPEKCHGDIIIEILNELE